MKLEDYQAVVVQGVVGCVTSAASGARCSDGFLSASFSKAATVLELTPEGGAGLIVSAAVGGTAAALGGGNFANGAVTAAFGYLFNHCATAANCWRDAQEGFVKAWRRVFVDPLVPDYVATSGSILSAQGGGALNLRDGSSFVAGGVAKSDPRGTTWIPGASGTVGWIWGAQDASAVNSFLGGSGNQAFISLPTGAPVNLFFAVTHSFGGSTAFEMGLATPGKLTGGVVPFSHAKKIGD